MIDPIIESWEYVPDTKNIFVVSDRGRVGELVGGEVEIIIDVDDEGLTNKKYKTVWLFGTKHYVHRLVAEQFLPNPNGWPHVNHIDLNSRHNCVINLEWCPVSWNNKHRTWTPKTKFNKNTLRWELKSGNLQVT